jgi:hypothetical protein
MTANAATGQATGHRRRAVSAKIGRFIAEPTARPSPAMSAVLINLFYGRPPWYHLRGRSMHGGAGSTAYAMIARGWITRNENQLTGPGALIAAQVAQLHHISDAVIGSLIQSHPCMPLVDVLRAERTRRMSTGSLAAAQKGD